jgi:hypothetical protein
VTEPMPDETPQSDQSEQPAADGATTPDTEPEWRRRRRLEAVFGDVLPETTSDEREAGDPDSSEAASDRWLRAQVPPHHG